MSTDLIRYAPGEALSADELVSRWSIVASELDQRSVLSRLCGECIKLFKHIAVSESVKDRVAPFAVRQLDRSRCRLILWADAYRVPEGGLDEAADGSRYLRRKVLRILSSIAETLIERFLPKLRLQESFTTEKLENCRQEALTSIQQDYRDREAHDSASESDGSDSDLSVSIEIEDTVESLETDTQLLMDLDRFIQAPSSLVDSDRQIAEEAPLREWQPEDAFAQIIRTRFPEAIETLVNALAKANLSRMQKCIEGGQAEPEQEAVVIAARAVPTSTLGGKTHNDSGYGTMPNSSLREAPSRYAETVMSYAAGDRTVKIPPLPAGAKEGKPFECVACSKKVSFTRSKMWKRHLFSDLRPWTCVEPDCSAVSATFQTRETWAQHLEFDHEYGPAWLSRPCALCKEPTGDGFDACTKHLSNHLEEISLAALPRPVDEEDVSQLSISANSSEAEETWACQQCDQVFDRPHKLNHHLRYHAKKHKCPHEGCGEAFGTKTHLQRHVQERHQTKKKYHCAVQDCQYARGSGRGFLRKDNWRRHMTRIHGMDSVEYSDGEPAVEQYSAWPAASPDADGWTLPTGDSTSHKPASDHPRDYCVSSGQTYALLLNDWRSGSVLQEDTRMGELVTVLDVNGDLWHCQFRASGTAYIPLSYLSVIDNPIKPLGWPATRQDGRSAVDGHGFPEAEIRPSSISFLDAIGRGFVFPLSLCSTMEEMNRLVQLAFADVDALKLRIQRGHYHFVDQSLGVISPGEWGLVLQPGSKIRMVLHPLDTTAQATEGQHIGVQDPQEPTADGDLPVETIDDQSQDKERDLIHEGDRHVPTSGSHVPAKASGSQEAEVLNRQVDESMQSRHEARDWHDEEWTSIENRLLGESRALWRKIKAHPDSYVMTRDEYAVFNTFRDSLAHDTLASEIEAKAAKRYWDNMLMPATSNVEEKPGSPLPLPDQTEADADAGNVSNSTPKQHKCPYCDQNFTRHHNLKSHLLTHSQEKPYVCTDCSMRFRRLHDLKRHGKLHSGEKPHVCPRCNKAFSRADALARHSESNCGSSQATKSSGDFETSIGTQNPRPVHGSDPDTSFSTADADVLRRLFEEDSDMKSAALALPGKRPVSGNSRASESSLGREAKEGGPSRRDWDPMRVPRTPSAPFMSADCDSVFVDDNEAPPSLPPPHFPIPETSDGHEETMEKSRVTLEGIGTDGPPPDSSEFGSTIHGRYIPPGPPTMLKGTQLASPGERNTIEVVPSGSQQTIPPPFWPANICPDCHSSFPSENDVLQHQIDVHWPQGGAKCSFCGLSFRQQAGLQLHLSNGCPQRYEYGEAEFIPRASSRAREAYDANAKTNDSQTTWDGAPRLAKLYSQPDAESAVSPVLLAARDARDRKRILAEARRLADQEGRNHSSHPSRGKVREENDAFVQETESTDAAAFSWNLDEASQVTSDSMRDFRCCGKTLPDLHALLQHYEETHTSNGSEFSRTSEKWKGEGSGKEFQLTQEQLEFVRASPYLSTGLTSSDHQADVESPGLYNDFSTPYYESTSDPSSGTAYPRINEPEVPKTISPKEAVLNFSAEDEDLPLLETIGGYPIFDKTSYTLSQSAIQPLSGITPAHDQRGSKLDRTMTDIYSDELYTTKLAGTSEETLSTGKMQETAASSLPNQRRIAEGVPKLDRTMADIFGDQLYDPTFQITPTARPEPSQGQETAGSNIFQQRLMAANQHHERESRAASLCSRSPFRTASPLAPPGESTGGREQPILHFKAPDSDVQPRVHSADSMEYRSMGILNKHRGVAQCTVNGCESYPQPRSEYCPEHAWASRMASCAVKGCDHGRAHAGGSPYCWQMHACQWGDHDSPCHNQRAIGIARLPYCSIHNNEQFRNPNWQTRFSEHL